MLLTSLSLTQTDFGYATVSSFCDNLTEHKTLQSFDVSKTTCLHLVPCLLSSLFSNFVAIQQIDASHNNIGVDGCNYLIGAINGIKGTHQILTLEISAMQ